MQGSHFPVSRQSCLADRGTPPSSSQPLLDGKWDPLRQELLKAQLLLWRSASSTESRPGVVAGATGSITADVSSTSALEPTAVLFKD